MIIIIIIIIVIIMSYFIYIIFSLTSQDVQLNYFSVFLFVSVS
jgi:hypothetical protein